MSGQAVRGGENEQLSLFSPRLAPRLLSRATVRVTSRDIPASWFYGFYCCEMWLHRYHNGSVNSKRTVTPKSTCQVLTSALAFNI